MIYLLSKQTNRCHFIKEIKALPRYSRPIHQMPWFHKPILIRQKEKTLLFLKYTVLQTYYPKQTNQVRKNSGKRKGVKTNKNLKEFVSAQTAKSKQAQKPIRATQTKNTYNLVAVAVAVAVAAKGGVDEKQRQRSGPPRTK